MKPVHGMQSGSELGLGRSPSSLEAVRASDSFRGANAPVLTGMD